MIWEIVNQPQWNIPDFGKLFFFSLSLRGKQVIELREREVALSDCHRHVRSNLTLIPGVLAVLHPQKLWRTR